MTRGLGGKATGALRDVVWMRRDFPKEYARTIGALRKNGSLMTLLQLSCGHSVLRDTPRTRARCGHCERENARPRGFIP